MNVNQQLWSYLSDTSTEISSTKPNPVAWSFDGQAFHQHDSIPNLSKQPCMSSIICSGEKDFLIPNTYIKERLPVGLFDFIYTKGTPQELIDILRNYWSIKLATQTAGYTPFTMVHMAVSLDGKIATANGHSKWIGNEQNLYHAHRLRAILDGILIGFGTVKADSPTLNVRRVTGQSPTRFVLSNISEDFSQLQKIKDAPTYLIRHKKYTYKNNSKIFDDIIYYEGTNKVEQINDILQKIRAKGIRSLLIEGGAKTVSCFLEANAVDVLQLHHTPLILGSGRSMVNLPKIDTIKEGMFLKHTYYTQMGNEIMTTGALRNGM